MRIWANPSSPHREGRAARAAIEDARARIKRALGWDGEVIFTSGASEAIAIALGRGRGDARLVSAIEHDAVLRCARDAVRIPVRADAIVDPDIFAALVARAAAPLVAVQHVNSELGVMQDMATLTALVREKGGLMLCDCAQSAGKVALPDADMIVVSAHKFGGPPGIGALLVREFAMLEPSGGQEFGYRGGTENLPGALGMAAALEAGAPGPGAAMAPWLEQLLPELLRLGVTVADAGGTRIAASAPRYPGITSFAMPGISSAAQLIRFDLAGFAVSAGSACSSGTLRPSHVLEAAHVADTLAGSVVRVSVGWSTTADDIARFGKAWADIAARAGNGA